MRVGANIRLTTVARMAGLVVSSCALVLVLAGKAFGADPSVAIPSGPLHGSQVITVTGSGFPVRAQDPTGLQMLECSDPDGSSANLPTDATYSCDGATSSPNQINTDAKGTFSVAYTVFALNSVTGGSDIDCDASHFCVLWVGIDYNNAFTSGPHAFSRPFEVTGTSASSSSSSDTAAPPPTEGAGAPAGSAVAAPGVVPISGTSADTGTLASTGVSGELWWLVLLGLVMAVGGTVGRRTLLRAESLPGPAGGR